MGVPARPPGTWHVSEHNTFLHFDEGSDGDTSTGASSAPARLESGPSLDKQTFNEIDAFYSVQVCDTAVQTDMVCNYDKDSSGSNDPASQGSHAIDSSVNDAQDMDSPGNDKDSQDKDSDRDNGSSYGDDVGHESDDQDSQDKDSHDKDSYSDNGSSDGDDRAWRDRDRVRERDPKRDSIGREESDVEVHDHDWLLRQLAKKTLMGNF